MTQTTISLTNSHIALIDDVDGDLRSFFWQAAKRKDGRIIAQRAVQRDGYRGTEIMHRVILSRMMGRPLLPKEQVDHINLNPLDNRRANLRLATNSQNQHNRRKYKNNTSGYKGVFWHKKNKRWTAGIRLSGKRIYLGSFSTAELAYKAYCDAAKELHGEFARFE